MVGFIGDTIYAHETPSCPRIHAHGSVRTRRALCMGALLVLLLVVAYPEQKRIAGSKAPCLRKSWPSSRSLST